MIHCRRHRRYQITDLAGRSRKERRVSLREESVLYIDSRENAIVGCVLDRLRS